MVARGLFGALYRRSLIYNQCWEDPAVDRQALRLTPDDRVMVITSAGCNALDYALTGARVIAVDANPLQNHLLELKLAAITALDFDSFFDLFGRGASGRAREMYRDCLRGRLTPAARGYWDHAVVAFEPRARGGSFYYSGASGLFALGVRFYIDRVLRLRGAIDRLLGAAGIEDQCRIWRDDVEQRLLGRLTVALLGTSGTLALLGVPAAQRAMVRAHAGGFGEFLRYCLQRVMSVALLRNNYFWLVYLAGHYLRETCPEYLKRDEFMRLKAGLARRIEVRTGTVTDALRDQRDPITAFVLLDHMDWLAGREALLVDEWRQIFAAAGSAARVIFRSAGVDAAFLPPRITERLSFDAPLAAALHRFDRVGTYGSFHIASLS